MIDISKLRDFAAVFACGVFATASCAEAQKVEVMLDDARGDAIEGFMSPFVDAAMFDGVVIADQGGEIVYEQGFGKASYEFDVSHSGETKFRIASLSKNVTDATLGVLIERGDIAIDDTVSKFLSGFPSGDKITIDHLIKHRSGIPHTNAQEWGGGDQSFPRAELLRRLTALPLDFEPGEKRSYSNGGYAVLAEIIGRVHGGGYGAALEELIFEQLGMDDTGDILNSRDVIAGMAEGYEPGPIAGERRRPRPYAAEMRPGGGSLYSTPRDMMKFYRGVLAGELFGPAVSAQVFGEEDKVYYRTGRSPGFSAQVRADKSTDSIVLVLANNYAFPQDLEDEIFSLLQGNEVNWPAMNISTERLSENDPRLGRYRWPDFIGAEGEIHLTGEGGMAFTDTENDYSSALLPLGDGEFIFTMYFFRCWYAEASGGDILCAPLSKDNEDSALRLTRID